MKDRFVGTTYRMFPPSVGIDKNWHVTDDMDTMVAHCYGFAHSIEGGEDFAERVKLTLNACRLLTTDELRRGAYITSTP